MKYVKVKASKLLEGSEDIIKQVAKLVKTSKKPLVDLRKPLESIFRKKDIDFALSPIVHFRIKTPKGILILVNKKHADEAEEIIDEIAIGYEGKI